MRIIKGFEVNSNLVLELGFSRYYSLHKDIQPTKYSFKYLYYPSLINEKR